MSEIWSKMYIGLHVKYPLFLSDFNKTYILSTEFREILKYQISWKSVQWESSCYIQTDGRTDRQDLIVAFRNFANASKNQYLNPDVPHKVCQTAGCYCMSYFEYECYTNICQIINRYTATIIVKFQNTVLSSFRLWQTLLFRINFSPQAWPARSPDLTPLSSLRGHMKDIIYR